MKKTLLSILILFLAGALPASAAAAQGPAVTPDGPLLAEISSLNRSMGEIVGLLEELLKGQQADLLMKRIQISTRGLTELERRLNGAKDERRHLEDEIERVRQEMERLQAAEIRVVELEDDLGERLDSLAAWEEVVDKALGLR